MVTQLRRLAAGFAAAFLAMALATGYWALTRSGTLLARGDNPRRVLDERRTARGTIYDRYDRVLAEAVGEPGALTRYYPYPALAPVLGYVSPLFGLAGIEAALDETLHGATDADAFELLWQGTVLGQPPSGRPIRLTLDLAVQSAADEALSARTGAVVVLDIRTGHLLALASHPSYDANNLESTWGTLVDDPNAPLLNRATQGLYQPGGALWPLTLATAAETDPGLLNATYVGGAQPVTLGGQTLGCRVVPPLTRLTLRESLVFGCPGPVAAIGEALGTTALDAALARFQVFTPPRLAINTTAAQPVLVTDAALAAVGQDAGTVTPLRIALMLAAVAGDGTMPAPQLVLATMGANGIWRPAIPEGQAVTALSQDAAALVRSLLPQDGYLAIAQGGTNGNTRSWYLDYSPRDNPKYVVVVLLEEGEGSAAQAIGRTVLSATGAGQP